MPLKPVTKVVPNLSAAAGTAGQGEFHFGVLKVCIALFGTVFLPVLMCNLKQLPLVNPTDTPQNQGDVVHHGIQEGTTEGLLYSGIFVEGIQNGINVGGVRTIKALVN